MAGKTIAQEVGLGLIAFFAWCRGEPITIRRITVGASLISFDEPDRSRLARIVIERTL